MGWTLRLRPGGAGRVVARADRGPMSRAMGRLEGDPSVAITVHATNVTKSDHGATGGLDDRSDHERTRVWSRVESRFRIAVNILATAGAT